MTRRSRRAPHLVEATGRRAGSGGFTLVEILIGMVIMALIGIAVAAVSITGVSQIGEGAQERQAEATTAQWSSLVFARDVQGAAGIAGECAAGSREHLVTLQASDSGRQLEYRRASEAPFDLVRIECGPGGSSRVVVSDLSEAPSVECEAADGTTVDCSPGTAPRRITLQVSRTEVFGFELDAARRITDGNSTDDPLEVPTFVSLGGDTPFSAGGNSQLQVIGNAFINRPSSGPTAVRLTGGPGNPGDPSSYRLIVTGDFELQAGALCSGCEARADKLPGTFNRRLPDPLRFMPEPETAALPTRTDCPLAAGVRVCEPGIYPGEFPPSGGGGGGVKDYELQPGIYVLRDGMKVNNGSITGSGVLLFNESGNIKVTGADLDLSPPTSGIYSGILLFQARSNAAKVEIIGNAQLASLPGTIYAPASNGVVLGGGGGALYVGRVIGQNLETFGGGAVIVDGS